MELELKAGFRYVGSWEVEDPEGNIIVDAFGKVRSFDTVTVYKPGQFEPVASRRASRDTWKSVAHQLCESRNLNSPWKAKDAS